MDTLCTLRRRHNGRIEIETMMWWLFCRHSYNVTSKLFWVSRYRWNSWDDIPKVFIAFQFWCCFMSLPSNNHAKFKSFYVLGHDCVGVIVIFEVLSTHPHVHFMCEISVHVKHRSSNLSTEYSHNTHANNSPLDMGSLLWVQRGLIAAQRCRDADVHPRFIELVMFCSTKSKWGL